MPEFEKDENGNYTFINSEGKYNYEDGSLEGSSYIATSPFNYYYEYDADGHITNIVFVNYRYIPAGTNVAIQVLYDNLKAFDFNDMDQWSIQANVEVSGDTYTPEPLTGLLDTSVDITKVIKNEYKESGVSYTPGLYTKNQIKEFTGTELTDSTYLDRDNLNDKYVYTVFKVEIEGTCNQRFDLTMQDIFPDDFINCGHIVGISKGESAREPATQLDDGSWDLGYYRVTDNEVSAFNNPDKIYDDEKFSAVCWVVAAYEKNMIPSEYVKTGTDENGKEYTYYELLNSVTVTINPEDGADSASSSSSTSTNADQYGNSITTWEPYFWNYYGTKGGDGFTATSKERNNFAEKLNGWFEGFNNFTASTDEGYDAGIKFLVSGTVQTYAATHQNLTDNTKYEEYTGGWVQTIFADDVLYATEYNGTSTQGYELTGNDYYIDGGIINMRDIGIDVYDDKTCAPIDDTALAANIAALKAVDGSIKYDTVDRNWYVYGLTANGEWEEIQTIDFNAIDWNATDISKNFVTIYNKTISGNRYYRIKVVHNTVDYSVEVKMSLNYKMLKTDGSKFKTFLEIWQEKKGTEQEAYKVVLDNYSAFTAYEKNTATDTNTAHPHGNGTCLVKTSSGAVPPVEVIYNDEDGNELNLILIMA